MSCCCVPNCNTRSSKHMHRFPNPEIDLNLFNMWLMRINDMKLIRMDHNKLYRNRRICHKHFDQFCSIPNSKFFKKGSLPTLFLPSFSGDSMMNCNIRFIKGPSNSNLELLNDTNVVPLQDVKKNTESSIERTLNDRKEDYRTNDANNIFATTEEYIESMVKLDPEATKIAVPEKDPLEDTYEELLVRYELLNKNYNDYKNKTEKDINLILEFLTDNSNGIYECPSCKYKCSTVNQIKLHLLAHAERRFCDVCFRVFYTEVAAVRHSRLHPFKRQSTCLGTLEDTLKDHQYFLNKS